MSARTLSDARQNRRSLSVAAGDNAGLLASSTDTGRRLSAAPPCDLSEWVWVLEETMFGHEWKHRFCRQNERPPRVYYHTSETVTEYVNFIALDADSSVSADVKSFKPPKDKHIACTLEVHSQLGVFLLGFETVDSMNRWKAAIENAIMLLILRTAEDWISETASFDVEKMNRSYDAAVLDVLVIEARGLPKMELFGTCNCSCKLSFPGYQRTRTGVIRNSLHPVWNEDFSFLLPQDSGKPPALIIALYHFESTSHEQFLSEATVELQDLLGGDVRDLWLNLTDRSPSSSKDPLPQGELHVRIQLSTPCSAQPSFLTAFGVTSSILPKRVDSGDVLLFSQTGIGARTFQKILLRSKWEHVALVVRRSNNSLVLLESTRCGVGVYKFIPRMEQHRSSAEVGVRRLLGVPRTVDVRVALDAFVTQVRGRPYAGVRELLQGYAGVSSRETHIEFFCSELVAATYKRLRLLDTAAVSANIMPSHFADDRLPLQNGASLDPHIHIFLPLLSKHWRMLRSSESMAVPPTSGSSSAGSSLKPGHSRSRNSSISTNGGSGLILSSSPNDSSSTVRFSPDSSAHTVSAASSTGGNRRMLGLARRHSSGGLESAAGLRSSAPCVLPDEQTKPE